MAVSPRVKPYMRRFNAKAVALAAQVPPFVALHHVGRRSGREYRTPVVAFAGRDPAMAPGPGTGPTAGPTTGPGTAAAPGRVMVATPLVWGRDADWCRNVRAAGSCTLTRHGRDYLVDDLRIVAPGDAVRIVGGGAALANAAFRPKEWMVGQLHRAPATS